MRTAQQISITAGSERDAGDRRVAFAPGATAASRLSGRDARPGMADAGTLEPVGGR
jgi:hypothetical protein